MNKYINTPQNQEYNEKLYEGINVNPLISTDNTTSVTYGRCNKCLGMCIAFGALVFGGLSNLIQNNEFSGIVILVIVILFILLLIFSKRNIEFIKEPQNNILIAKVYNYFGCRCKKKTFNFLKNVQFDVRQIPSKGGKLHCRLFIFNNLSYLKNINLENSDIKINPAQLYYCFNKLEPDSGETSESIKNRLNKFTNSPLDFDCPIFFDAYKYKNRNNNSGEKYMNPVQIIYSKLMRFSDYFYTYHVRDPNKNLKEKKCETLFLYIYFNIFIAIVMAGITLEVLRVKNVMLLILIVIGTPLFLDLIFFLIYLCLQNRVLRIDCIFSINFDKMFIGLTTINNKFYKFTHEFNTYEINNFSAIREYNSTTFSVTVNGVENNICELCDGDEGLNDFVYILNEKISNIKNSKND